MKIAVYTIAKNEEQFVERWFNSAKDADYLLIADTGSNDGTIELANSLGINTIQLSINPWRFDDARNAALAQIPADIDYCISLDMDEVLSDGWRKELESINPIITRPTHKLIASWTKDGKPDLEFNAVRIHSRNGYRWRHPIHEALYYYGSREVSGIVNITIEHHPDNSKSRGQYLPLLKMAAQEDPMSDRNAFYYARELYFHKMFKDASNEFRRHLSLPTSTWRAERSASMRYLAKCSVGEEEYWLNMAMEEYPEGREQVVDLSEYYYKNKDWEKCKEYALKSLEIKDKNLGYFIEADAWTWKPYDLLAISCYHLGEFEAAVENGQKAVDLFDDERLKNNLAFYMQAMNGKMV